MLYTASRHICGCFKGIRTGNSAGKKSWNESNSSWVLDWKWCLVPSMFCVLSALNIIFTIYCHLPIDCYQWSNSNQAKRVYHVYFVDVFEVNSSISYNFLLSAILTASRLGLIASSNVRTICLCKELSAFAINIFGVWYFWPCDIMYKMD